MNIKTARKNPGGKTIVLFGYFLRLCLLAFYRMLCLLRQRLESSDCKDHSQDNQSDGPDGLEPGSPVSRAATDLAKVGNDGEAERSDRSNEHEAYAAADNLSILLVVDLSCSGNILIV